MDQWLEIQDEMGNNVITVLLTWMSFLCFNQIQITCEQYSRQPSHYTLEEMKKCADGKIGFLLIIK